jgi:3-hydroxybutyryl-CoA dehydratase
MGSVAGDDGSAPLSTSDRRGSVNPVLDMLTSLTLFPALYSQAALLRTFQWQREQVEALTKLMASFMGQEYFGNGAVQREPKDADLFVGKSISHTKMFTDMHTVFFGLLSLDFNPLHFNEAMSRRTRFKGRIAHGFHTASMFSGVLAELTPWCVYLRQDMEFTAPVRPGDVITATGVIEEIDPKGVLQVGLSCTNQRNEVVVRGRAVVKKLKEIYNPEAAKT